MQEDSPKSGEIHEDRHLLRLGYYDHANLLPLLYPVEAGWAAPESPWRLEVVNAPPSVLREQMLQGKLDAAFLPPTDVSKNNDRLSTLGGWGLSCEARSETAILLAPNRLDLINETSVSITLEALDSTAHHLLLMLLAPYYGIELTIHTPGDPGYDLQGARLLYGDKAAKQAANKPPQWAAEHLGVAWWVFSGLPLVWEILAVSRDLDERKPGASEQLQTLLKLSERTAQEQKATIVDVATKRLSLNQEQIKDLFSRQRYRLGDQEQKSLARFLELAGKKPRRT